MSRGDASMPEGPGERRERVPTLAWIATGAVLLRIALMFGRGDYVAFDEGWYLLLGRNLWSGEGYTLSGLQHVALSPLFPILSGAAARVSGDAVWAGRFVAAVAAGLVVVPCWFLFRRLAGERVATLGAIFVCLLPSLAAFVVPYWIGWDLWVGAEPLLHLFLFIGLALLLRAWEIRSLSSAFGCGAAFAVAYLARPEAVGTFGLAGLIAVGFLVALRRRERVGGASGTDRDLRRGGEHDPLDAWGALRGRPKRITWRTSRPLAFAACALTFVGVAGPYWLYLHDALDRWALTGRWVQLTPSIASPTGGNRTSSNRIEDMLWHGDDAAYVRSLYSLDRPGTSLANGYWGVRPSGAGQKASLARESSAVQPSAVPAGSATPSEMSSGPSASPSIARERPPTSPWLLRYARALGIAFPWYLWLFVLPGLAAPGRDRRPGLSGDRANRRRFDLEALVAIPLIATSVLIARIVAIDPRTQLFLAPLAAFYAARGVLLVSDLAAKRLEGRVRPEMVPRALVGALVIVLLGTSVSRLVLSLTVGSPHHVVAAENAAVGAAIRRSTPEDVTVMSFHPAVALFADRDWRVLPMEPLDRIVRYARTQPSPYLVLSVFYPPEIRPLEEPHYLIVPVAADLPERDRWRIHVPERARIHAFGELVPME